MQTLAPPASNPTAQAAATSNVADAHPATSLGSLAGAMLAATAVAGRLATFLADGPTPMYQLVALVIIGASACALGTHALRTASSTGVNRLFGRIGQRAGAVQTLLGTALIASHLI